MRCLKCGSEEAIKHGQHLGKQRWKCKGCGYQYTREERRGRSAQEKAMALMLYVHGLSMNAIAKLLGVSMPAVLKWVRRTAELTYEKPAPGSAVVVELDEMWHFLRSKKTSCGSGRLIVAIPVSSLIGNVGIVINAPCTG